MVQQGFDIENLANINVSDLAELFASVGWGSIEDYQSSELSTLLKTSTFYSAAFHDKRLIGFVRVLSDRVMVSWIAEIIVSPDWQRKGVGFALLSKVIQEFGHTAIYSAAFRGTEDFFKNFNLKERPGKLVAISRRPESFR